MGNGVSLFDCRREGVPRYAKPLAGGWWESGAAGEYHEPINAVSKEYDRYAAAPNGAVRLVVLSVLALVVGVPLAPRTQGVQQHCDPIDRYPLKLEVGRSAPFPTASCQGVKVRTQGQGRWPVLEGPT